MARLLKIGIVGCGAIGSSLAKAIAKDFSRQAKLAALFDVDTAKSRKLSKTISGSESLVVKDLARLIRKSELVIESASAKCSWEIARDSLVRQRDVMVMSVGGIVSRFSELSSLAERYDSKVFIPSGAISGIDALKAARLGKIQKVILTTYKSPRAFKGVKYVEAKKIDLDKIKCEKILFSGSAREAVRFFPQNINVAAILSIAGLGADKTKVKIIASPLLKRNIHEIEIYSESGRIFTRTENILHPDNPKTSFLAVLSAIATLKQILSPVRIGT